MRSVFLFAIARRCLRAVADRLSDARADASKRIMRRRFVRFRIEPGGWRLEFGSFPKKIFDPPFDTRLDIARLESAADRTNVEAGICNAGS